MKGHGGRRPGSGRKPKAIERQQPPVIAAENKLRDRLPELVDAALRLALEDGNERMLIYCIDRVLGRPTQPIDVVTRVRDLAAAQGLTDEEAAEAVAEVERMMRFGHAARG